MEVTEEQFNNDLVDKLKESGHKLMGISPFFYHHYLVSFGEEDVNVLTNLMKPLGYEIPGYNPDLFLALVNMSSLKECRAGEYVKYVGPKDNTFTINKLYKLNKDLNGKKAVEQDDNGKVNGFNAFSRNKNFEFLIKPTFEEILAHFGIFSPTFKITPEFMAEKLKKIQELTR